jgi:hypothetical protein
MNAWFSDGSDGPQTWQGFHKVISSGFTFFVQSNWCSNSQLIWFRFVSYQEVNVRKEWKQTFICNSKNATFIKWLVSYFGSGETMSYWRALFQYFYIKRHFLLFHILLSFSAETIIKKKSKYNDTNMTAMY